MSKFDQSRIHLVIPSNFVIPKKLPPPPPPVPGTVKAEDLRPPVNPPQPFLKPWATHIEATQSLKDGQPIPCAVDPALLGKYLQRHDVETTVRTVFKDKSGSAEGEELVQNVLASLLNPFTASSGSDIVWTLIPAIKPNPTMDTKLGGKKLKTEKRHKILNGPAPWSIVSFADEMEVSDGKGLVRRNMVYDGDCNAIVQIDFGHGPNIGIHGHALILGNLEHTAGNTEDHMFPLEVLPWPWVCIPDVRFSADPGRAGVKLFSPPSTWDMVDQGGEYQWIPITMPFEDFMGRTASSMSE